GIFSWPDGGILGWPPTVHRGWCRAARQWRTCTPGVVQCSAAVAHVYTEGGTVRHAGGARGHRGRNTAARRWRTWTPRVEQRGGQRARRWIAAASTAMPARMAFASV